MDANIVNTDFDVAICGAGPVGLALAALLVRAGMDPARIALADGKTLEQSVKDPRSIALSWGSRQILEQVGAWSIPATPIQQIHVSRRGQFGRTLIDHAEHGVPSLGYVSRYGTIVEALAEVCAQSGVATLRPLRLVSSAEGPDDVLLELDGPQPRKLSARLLVQAEGGLFADQAEKALRRDYTQTAVIAQVEASAPIANRAYERFTNEGPLALLPEDEGQGQRYALVWCVRPATAAHLLELDDAAFLAALGEAFGGRLGQFRSATPRMSFPLGLNAQPAGSERSVAVGNAAQTLHPVAGQGLNLGLRDAAVLAGLLARDTSPASLAEFARLRKVDREVVVRLTDTMARVFAAGSAAGSAASHGGGALQPEDPRSVLQGLLGLGLGALDAVPPARHVLAELMMYGWRP